MRLIPKLRLLTTGCPSPALGLHSPWQDGGLLAEEKASSHRGYKGYNRRWCLGKVWGLWECLGSQG